jgi:hypothetical protein
MHTSSCTLSRAHTISLPAKPPHRVTPA